MPAGKITAHVSGTSDLIQRIRLPAQLHVEVVGGDSRAGASLTPEKFKDAAAAAAADGQKVPFHASLPRCSAAADA